MSDSHLDHAVGHIARLLGVMRFLDHLSALVEEPRGLHLSQLLLSPAWSGSPRLWVDPCMAHLIAQTFGGSIFIFLRLAPTSARISAVGIPLATD